MRPIEGNYETLGDEALSSMRKCILPTEWNLKTRMKMPGDGILLYPGDRHVLPSIRLANVRDGEEDFEYLAMAEVAIGREKVAAMVRRVVASPTKFTRDAAVLATLRERLADAIENAASPFPR